MRRSFEEKLNIVSKVKSGQSIDSFILALFSVINVFYKYISSLKSPYMVKSMIVCFNTVLFMCKFTVYGEL